MDRDLYLHRLTQPEAARLLEESQTAIVVVGSVEQHGPHLPLGTDGLAALGVAERVAEHWNSPILLLSLIGVAPYHLPWPGSLTLRPATLVSLFVDACTGLQAAGADRIVIVNWHEGNTPTLRLAAADVQRDLGVQVVIAETHIITNQLFPEEMEFTHAGAMETAGVLAYDETLVHLDRIEQTPDRHTGEERHALFRQRDVFPILDDFHQISAAGWYGAPRTVSKERADEIFDHVARHVIERTETIWATLDPPKRP